MSRMRFEWQVESQQIDRSDSEDPKAKGRRRNILRLLLVICALLVVIALGLLFLRQRLLDVETQFAQLLQDTVKAEAAALRIGDINSFLNIQSADNEDWLNRQRAIFQRYSDLKSAGSIELTGSILAMEIDGERARVLVRENINDLPYARLWFYRHASEGWQHIAPAYSYWGEMRKHETASAVVNYRAVDHEFARQFSDALEDWIRKGCALLDCGSLPKLTIDVRPEAADEAAWRDQSTMQLIVRSPYVDVARADTPFDGGLRLRVSQLLAERLVNAHTDYQIPTFPHDARYLWQSSIAWLGETFTRLDSGATLMRSLAENYGDDKIAVLLSLLSDTSDLSVLQRVIGQPLELVDLDWRDFIAWRLNLEASLISAGRQNEWLNLYDTSDESARLAAYDRYNRNAAGQDYLVIDQLVWSKLDGEPQLRVTAQVAGDESLSEEIILFNLVDDVWKRAS